MLLLLITADRVPSTQAEAATSTSAKEPATAEAPATAATPAKPVAPPPPIPLELQPYRVRISVAFNDEPSLSPHFRQVLLAELATWVDRTYAEMWQVTFEDNQWLAPTSIDGLSRLTGPQVETQLGDKELDKAFIVCVSS